MLSVEGLEFGFFIFGIRDYEIGMRDLWLGMGSGISVQGFGIRI